MLRDYGAPVSDGHVATTPEEAVAAAGKLKPGGWVVKAQIHAGGRGKGGGVKVAKSIDEVRARSKEILGMQLITHETGPQGQKVRRLLIEEGADIKSELYAGMVVDRGTQKVVLMASSEGGMDIEEVAAKTPEKIRRVYIDPLQGLTDADADEIALSIGIPQSALSQGRTVFKGHLFVGDVLLSDSGMRHHPLTPMTDANLVRVMQAQCERRVGLVDYRVVARGPDAVRARFDALRGEGVRIAIVDAISNDDLWRLGPALKGMPLVTAASGVAIALPANFGFAPTAGASTLPAAAGRKAVIAGSCSQATQRQVRAFIDAGGPAFRVDPLAIASGAMAERALEWAASRRGAGPVLVYSTAEATEVESIQRALGAASAGASGSSPRSCGCA